MAAVVAVAACVTLLLCVFLIASFGSVKQNEYGLVFNWVTKSITPKVYHGGRHFIGPFNTFIQFPATVQTVEFSDRVGRRTSDPLHTRTKEGLGLNLSISFQYKLKPADIPKLFALTNTLYEGLFTRLARDQLLEAAAEYEGPQYWLERDTIADYMQKLVGQNLNQSYATLRSLQLLDIQLPTTYEDSITKTQVQNQLIQTRKNQQVAASIRADTEILKSKYERDISVTQAGARANFTLKTKTAQAEASARKISAEAEALEYVRKTMNLTTDDTVGYARLTAYSQLENATLLANMGNAMPMLNIGGTASTPPSSSRLRGTSVSDVNGSAVPDSLLGLDATDDLDVSFLQHSMSLAKLDNGHDEL